MRILAVVSNKNLGKEISSALSPAGYTVTTVYDSTAGLEAALSGIYEAAVISSRLSPLDGMELLSRLRREESDLYILLLTGPGSAPRIAGLNAGADYCQSLPFEPAELSAQLRVLLRRQCKVFLPDLSFGDITLNTSTCALLCGQRQARLSSTELELMRLLIINGKRVLSKETLFIKIWGYDAEVNIKIIETYISALRKKLRNVESGVTIKTIWCQGYHLSDNASPANTP